MLIYSKLSSNLEQEPHPQPPHRLRGGGLVVCQIYFDGFLVVRAYFDPSTGSGLRLLSTSLARVSEALTLQVVQAFCPRERDAHTTGSAGILPA